jgi:hypothetical protein
MTKDFHGFFQERWNAEPSWKVKRELPECCQKVYRAIELCEDEGRTAGQMHFIGQ